MHDFTTYYHETHDVPAHASFRTQGDTTISAPATNHTGPNDTPLTLD